MVNDHGYKDTLNVRTIGKHMKALGFTSTPKKIAGATKRIIEIEVDRLEHLIYRYVPIDDQPRLIEFIGKNLNPQTELTFSVEKIDISEGPEVT
ncbi:MAG: hypothetical protein KKG04_02320, partial [Candidatus Thermoplasmatota archaeon]|nr:hypothetical protein [Candidatus Thermoplasmatota archaeon]